WESWFLTWENETQALVQEAIFGRRTPTQALADSHRRFVELSAQQPSH
ncbi:MAG: hypothetical protein FJ029_04035, partial [Actinobacteria bacterium]|nr:hypothetical protein [Actinomycetota bacterium]